MIPNLAKYVPDIITKNTAYILTALRRLNKKNAEEAADLVCIISTDKFVFSGREKFLSHYTNPDSLAPAWAEEPVTTPGKAVWVTCREDDGTVYMLRLVDRDVSDEELEVTLIQGHMADIWNDPPNSTEEVLELFPLNPLFTRSVSIERKTWDLLCTQLKIAKDSVIALRGARTVAITPKGMILTVVIGTPSQAEAVCSFVFGEDSLNAIFGPSFFATITDRMGEDTSVAEESVMHYWHKFAANNALDFRTSALVEAPDAHPARGGDA